MGETKKKKKEDPTKPDPGKSPFPTNPKKPGDPSNDSPGQSVEAGGVD